MEPVTFTSKLSYNEYFKYALYRYSKSWFIWFLYAVCVYLVLLSVFAQDLGGAETTIIASITVMVIIPLRMYLSIRKKYKSNPFSGTEIYWKISESGLTYQQGSAEGGIGWDRVDKFTENKNWVMIWFNKKIIFYFQKNNLSSEQLTALKKIAHRAGKGFFR